MNTQELKKIMRALKLLFADLENQAIEEGVDLASSEYETMQNKVREMYLAKHGYTLEEYKEAKNKVTELQSTILKGDQGIQGEPAHTPTNEELIDLIKPLIPEPKHGKTPSKEEILSLLKPLIPKVKDGQTPSNERLISLIKPLMPHYDAEIGYLEDKINNIKIPIPEKINVEKLKEDIREEFKNHFSENFKKNIDVLGMPDFRKLAMGLQGQIDDVKASAGSGSDSFGIMIDGQGGVISTGNKGLFWVAPYACTITGWTLLSADNTSGSIVIDVWKDTYSNYPPTVADTIFGTKPSLVTTTKNQATGLSIAVTSGDIFYANVDSVTSLIKVGLMFQITKS